MTQPDGEIRVNLSVDATGFESEVDRAVSAATGTAQREVRSAVNTMNRDLGRVDASPIEEIGDAARGAVPDVNALARAIGGSVDSAGRLRDARGRFVAIGDAARRAAEGVDELDRANQRAQRSSDRATSAMAGGFGRVFAGIRTVLAKIVVFGPLFTTLGSVGVGALASLSAGFAALGVAAGVGFAAIKLGAEGIKQAASNAQAGLDTLRAGVSQTFATEMAGAFTKLGTLMSDLTPAMQGVASSISTVFSGVVDAIVGPGRAAVDQIVAGAATFISALGPGLEDLTLGILDFAATAAESAQVLGTAFSNVFGGIGNTLSELSADGSLTRFFEGAAPALEGLGKLLESVIVLFVQLGGAVGTQVGAIFAGLGDIIREIGPELAAIASAVGDGLVAALPGLKSFAEGFTNILVALGPLAEPLGQIVGLIGQAFGDALTAVSPAIFQLAQALSQAIQPLIPIVSDLIGQLAPILGQIAGFLAAALVPVIKIFGDLLAQLLPKLQPLIAAFGQLVSAVLPPLQRIIVALLPVLSFLAQAFGAIVGWLADKLAPIITFVAGVIGVLYNAFASFIEFIVAQWPLVQAAFEIAWAVISTIFDAFVAVVRFLWDITLGPIFELIKAGIGLVGDAIALVWNNIIKPAWDALGSGIEWVWENVIRPAWDAMKSGLQSVGDFFGDTIDGIRNVWNGLKRILAVPVNFLINTVWNGGILKAWNAVADFLPGIDPAEPLKPIAENATGGAINGPGSGTSDSILSWLSNGEHVVTAMEVMRAGGQNVLYAIRDMIKRGIPFSWDNGKIVREIGKSNLQHYGSKVRARGYGNVNPEGLFNELTRAGHFATGGAVKQPQPWETELARGHEWAKARNGRPYVWGGSADGSGGTDCSGFMSGIADVILGGTGVRRWATSSFPGGQSWNAGLGPGFSVGIFDDPGGPGGGHTAGTLGPVLNFGSVNVESGGSHGNVAYGGPAVGADHSQFPDKWHLAIGANGGFVGGGTPSPAEQRSFLEKKVIDLLRKATDPIKETIASKIGAPPPKFLGIPGNFLDHGTEEVGKFFVETVQGLGDTLGGAWQAAKDFVDPFDHGGVARGVGFMRKDTIAPERVLSPEQTKLFELLVGALTQLGGGGLRLQNQGLFGTGGNAAQQNEDAAAAIAAALSDELARNGAMSDFRRQIEAPELASGSPSSGSGNSQQYDRTRQIIVNSPVYNQGVRDFDSFMKRDAAHLLALLNS